MRALAVLAAIFTLVSFGELRAAPAVQFDHARIGNVDGAPTLLVDGRPFFFFGGAFFYARIPPERWSDSMLAMRRLGANTLDLYIPWNWHEVADGQFDFDGHTNPRRDLRRVLRLARRLGFELIVRPGPMARNEWRNGGYPDWLLRRPDYHMPLHDILEGRYAATATLQNTRSDDAAAEWLRNPTHMRYAARWLHAVMNELRPYADRVVAIQLDDDQGAYTDNQTWPAPHFHQYIHWLDQQVRAVAGPTVPTFINTFDMKVPASAPAWAMGNWYGTALHLAEHDRTELDFATATLTTQERVPLAFSEFQAGWLAAPEDPQPRPAEASNTALALAEILGWGAHGVIMFPLQDTLTPFGWEAPFANAFYGWNAAIARDPAEALHVPDRYAPTSAFGVTVADWGPWLARTHRFAQIAIAYGVSALDPRRLDRNDVATIDARFKDALRSCTERGLTCDAVDLRFASVQRLRTYRTLVVPPFPGRVVASIAARLARVRGLGVAVVEDVPDEHGPGIVPLVGRDVSFGVASNWNDTPAQAGGTVRLGERSVDVDPVALAPRSARLLVLDLRLRSFVPGGPDVRVTSTCRLIAASHDLIADATDDACSVVFHNGSEQRTVHLADERLHLATLARDRQIPLPAVPLEPSGAAWTALAAGERIRLTGLRPRGSDGAIAYQTDAFGSGDATVVMQNAKLRAIFVPGGGARLVSLQRIDGPGDPLDAVNATGALRDDVLRQPPPSRTDRIARYTHSYPAGMFNRTYRTEILAARGRTAVVRFSYDAPDVVPRGAHFERTISLAADSPRLVVDEKVSFTRGPGSAQQRAVTLSALAVPPPALPQSLDRLVAPTESASGTGPAGAPPASIDLDPREGVAAWNASAVIAVMWNAGSVAQATWTPYRSNGTLTLVAASGTLRTTYALAAARTADEAAAFARAEREWIAAHPIPSAR